MSYNIPSEYYWNRGPVAYGPGFDEPVPGWGMRPNTVGPAVVGIGADPMLDVGATLASEEDKKQLFRMVAALKKCCPANTCCSGVDREYTVKECADAYLSMSDYAQRKIQEGFEKAKASPPPGSGEFFTIAYEIEAEIQRRKMMPLYIAGGVAAVGLLGLGVWYYRRHRSGT